jgi:hypothetical protein
MINLSLRSTPLDQKLRKTPRMHRIDCPTRLFPNDGPRISSPRTGGPCSAVGRRNVAGDLEEPLRRWARDFDDIAEDIGADMTEASHPGPPP